MVPANTPRGLRLRTESIRSEPQKAAPEFTLRRREAVHGRDRSATHATCPGRPVPGGGSACRAIARRTREVAGKLGTPPCPHAISDYVSKVSGHSLAHARPLKSRRKT